MSVTVLVIENATDASLEEIISFIKDHTENVVSDRKTGKIEEFEWLSKSDKEISFVFKKGGVFWTISHALKKHNGKIKISSRVERRNTGMYWVKSILAWIFFAFTTMGIGIIVYSFADMIMHRRIPIKFIGALHGVINEIYGF